MTRTLLAPSASLSVDERKWKAEVGWRFERRIFVQSSDERRAVTNCGRFWFLELEP